MSLTSREVIQEVVMEFRFEEPNSHILSIVTMIVDWARVQKNSSQTAGMLYVEYDRAVRPHSIFMFS